MKDTTKVWIQYILIATGSVLLGYEFGAVIGLATFCLAFALQPLVS